MGATQTAVARVVLRGFGGSTFAASVPTARSLREFGLESD